MKGTALFCRALAKAIRENPDAKPTDVARRFAQQSRGRRAYWGALTSMERVDLVAIAMNLTPEPSKDSDHPTGVGPTEHAVDVQGGVG